MKIRHCHNFADFRKLSKKRLPSPIFHYIDGAADDEKTYKRNTEAFDTVDLVPNVLAGVDKVDMSVTVMGQHLSMPIYCAPTALQRLLEVKQEEIEYEKRDHALFIAFAPVKNPKYAISVVVEHGGSGSSAAAPIAKKVIKKVLERHELREGLNLTGEDI